VLAAGLGGFVLGAATVMLVVWMAGISGSGGGPGGPPATAASSGAAPPPAGAPRAGAGAPPSGASPGGPAAAPGSVSPPGAPGAASAPGPASPDGDQTPNSASPPPPNPGGGEAGTPDEIADLRRRHLLMPVQGVRREELRDSFEDARTGHVHEALDIMAPRNSPVLAVEDGRVTKLFYSRQGGNTIYQFDPGQTYTYYYAHLERYAPGLHEGDALSRGQVIGYVGSSGNASPEAPHLHFAIFVLNPDRHWWQGRAVNPFRVFAPP
jgi:murein DD-endopeptidase MepM/ murein hydrolase activator NlpD